MNFRELVKKADNVDLFTIRIEVMRGELQAVAGKLPYFVYRDGNWVVDTGLGGTTQLMTPVSGHGWRGFHASSSARCYHDGGGYAGICDIFVAVISNGRLSSVFNGGAQTGEEFTTMLKSFRFLR